MKKNYIVFISLIFLVIPSMSAFGAEELQLDKYQKMAYQVKPSSRLSCGCCGWDRSIRQNKASRRRITDLTICGWSWIRIHHQP